MQRRHSNKKRYNDVSDKTVKHKGLNVKEAGNLSTPVCLRDGGHDSRLIAKPACNFKGLQQENRPSKPKH